MNKLTDSFGLNSDAVSIDALKSAEKGEMVVFVDDAGAVTLFRVIDKVATRGRKGGTSLALENFVTDAVLKLPTTNTLPDGVIMVRKVLKGVNARTLRKVVPEDATSGIVSDESATVSAPETSVEPAANVAVEPTVATESVPVVETAPAVLDIGDGPMVWTDPPVIADVAPVSESSAVEPTGFAILDCHPMMSDSSETAALLAEMTTTA